MEKTRQEKLDDLKNLNNLFDLEFGLDSTYTLEQFEIDMEKASPEQMEDILMKGIDNLNVLDPLVKEALSEYRQELEFLKEQMSIDVDADCNKDIDSGDLTLYKCIKDFPLYGIKADQNYYVKEDDVREANLSRFKDVNPSESLNIILERINNMTPIYWVYIDSGLGTLKRKVSFGTDPTSKAGSFTEHFEKFSF